MLDFEKLLSEVITLKKEEKELVLSFFKPVLISKENYFLVYGKRCHEIAFIQKGVLRIFHKDENGEEVTHYFPPQGSFVTSHESMNTNTPSKEGIQAITDAELLVITKENLDFLYQKVPAIQDLGRWATENVVAEMSKRISILINNSAEKRYSILMEQNAVLIQTVPLHYLASYLGITPQHLSRIRKKIS